MVGAWRQTPSIPTVILYSRAGCPPCQQAKTLLRALRHDVPFTLMVRDVDRDEQARATYSDRVPVILINGQDVRSDPLDETALRRALKAAIERT